MIDFSTLQGLTIPEGNVTKIESGGVVLWEIVNEPAYAAIYGDNTLVFGRGKSAPESYKGMTLTAAFDSANGYNVETDLYGFDQDWETYTMPWYNYRYNITSVKFITKVAPARTSYWFMGLSKCTDWEISKLDTSKVEYMAQMFASTSGLAEDDLLNLNTSKVKNMYGMFQGTSAVSLDLSTWNTSNCTSFGSMFADTYDLKNLDLSGWDTTKATDMSYMFAYGNALESITLGANWSFTGDGSTNCELPDGNWKHVETSNMYAAADLAAGYDGSTMSGTYEKQILSAYAAVYGGDTLVLGKAGSVPASYNDKALTESWSKANGYDIENTNYTSKSNVPWYSSYASAITSVAVIDTVKPISTGYWFYNMSKCTSMGLDLLDTSTITTGSMANMFYGCSKLTSLALPEGFGSNVTSGSMYSMFQNCSTLTSLDLPAGFASQCTGSMYSMFRACSSLTSLTLPEGFGQTTSNVMSMFFGCKSLTSLTLPAGFGSTTTKFGDYANGIWGMFQKCTSLTTIDLSSVKTNHVTDMSNMFSGCSSLTTIYASNLWSTTAVTSSSNMFYGCTKLKGHIAFNSSKVDKTYAKTRGGYLTYKAAS